MDYYITSNKNINKIISISARVLTNMSFVNWMLSKMIFVNIKYCRYYICGLVLPPVHKIRNQTETVKIVLEPVQNLFQKPFLSKISKKVCKTVHQWSTNQKRRPRHLLWVIDWMAKPFPQLQDKKILQLYVYSPRHWPHSRYSDGFTWCRKIHCFLTNRQALTFVKHRQWKKKHFY